MIGAPSLFGNGYYYPVGRNDRNSSRKRVNAGSPSSMMWFRLSRGTKRAPGIPAANRRPASKGTRESLRACITRVGTLTCDRSELTSTSPFARRLRAASVGVRDSLKFVEPVGLLLIGVRNKLRREHLSERRIFLNHPRRIKVSIASPAALSASVRARFFQPTAKR